MAVDPQSTLTEIADGVFAYLAGDPGWGWSNAGLVCGEGQSLLVDTLFDLELTQRMLDGMAQHTATQPIRQLVNTHANGDHCYGNELVTGAEIIGSTATKDELERLPPSALAAMTAGGFGEPLDSYLQSAFGPFRFDNITATAPTRTFDHQLTVDAGGRTLELFEVGPAHTAGDVIAHLPDAGVVFTGDILFIAGTPIIWDGPVANWIAACDRIDGLGASTIVPGHGPVTDHRGVAMVRDYLAFVHAEASARHAAGFTALDAARDIELGSYRDWSDFERIVINVDAVYRELDPAYEPLPVLELFGAMATYLHR
ncbi:MAG: MBL fold metallo-hydrolase [Acidimicrobiales bacterium]|nr:MBL fold metallo-hydrolase [Acidimicrobiales bacterium]